MAHQKESSCNIILTKTTTVVGNFQYKDPHHYLLIPYIYIYTNPNTNPFMEETTTSAVTNADLSNQNKNHRRIYLNILNCIIYLLIHLPPNSGNNCLHHNTEVPAIISRKTPKVVSNTTIILRIKAESRNQ